MIFAKFVTWSNTGRRGIILARIVNPRYRVFWVGISTISGSLAVEAVLLYYTGSEVRKDVFYGNRFEGNISADIFGHIGFTGVYAPLVDGTSVFGIGVTFGFGFSTTVVSGNINYGRTQSSFNSMIVNLVPRK